MTTGVPKGEKPSWATVPGAGSRLKRPNVLSPSLVCTVTVPTWVEFGQFSPERLSSNGERRGVLKRARVQTAVTLGLTINPLGITIRRSRTSPSGKVEPGWLSNSPPGLKPTLKVSSYGCVPDEVAGSP